MLRDRYLQSAVIMAAEMSDYTLRRRFPRAPVYCPVVLMTDSGAEEYAATSLNEGGLTLLKTEAPPPGARLSMSIELLTGRIIQTEAEARATLPGLGFGVEFLPLAAEELARIRQAVVWAFKNPTIIIEPPPTLELIVRRLEMRRQPRAPLFLEVGLESETTVGRGLTCDVSLRGVGLHLKRPLGTGQQLNLIGPKRRFVATIEVRNCTPFGNLWRVGATLLSVEGNWLVR
jgi:hypothetical protein